jgi:hypothetical protein
MRKIIGIVAAAICAAVLFSEPSLAKYAKQRHHVTRVHVDYSRHHVSMRHAGRVPSQAAVNSYTAPTALISTMERYLGGNPTGWRHNWCAQFLNMALKQSGLPTTGSALAASFTRYGRPSPIIPGAIVVVRGGHHVAVITAVRPDGTIETISGNHGHIVGRGVYRIGSVISARSPG